MLKPTPLTEQIEHADQDRLRVLIVGAGVAGVTLAQLLRADGLHPVLAERTGPQADPGYMIALMPLADPVLERLGVRETYRDHSVEFRRYRLRSSHGRTIRTYAMGDILDRYGDYRGLDRGSLLRVLASKGGAVSQESTLTAIQQRPDAARVTLRGAWR